MRRRLRALQFCSSLAWILSSACNSNLDTSLDRKECTRSGECLPGYECSEDDVCVRRRDSMNEQPSMSEPDAATIDAAPQGDEAGVPVGMPMPQPPAPTCSDGSLCDGVCTDVMHDIDNCGACGRQRPAPANAQPACDEGVCAIRCDDQSTRCGESCYQLSNDAQHCGDCAFSCAVPANGRAQCVGSRCTAACDPGTLPCGSACVRADVDPLNCGKCGVTCAAGEQCSQGACVKDCPPGTKECARSCVDVLADPQHCGVCDNVCGAAPMDATTRCDRGMCSWQCSPGRQNCGDACVDLQADPLNCGGCGRACPPPPSRGSAVCRVGACIVQCSDDYTNCGGQCVSPALIRAAQQAGFGSMPPCAALAAYQNYYQCQNMGQNYMFCGNACVNVTNSREHCGGCGRACDAGEMCLRGNCDNRRF